VLTADCVRGIGLRVGMEGSGEIVRQLLGNVNDEPKGKIILKVYSYI